MFVGKREVLCFLQESPFKRVKACAGQITSQKFPKKEILDFRIKLISILVRLSGGIQNGRNIQTRISASSTYKRVQ